MLQTNKQPSIQAYLAYTQEEQIRGQLTAERAVVVGTGGVGWDRGGGGGG